MSEKVISEKVVIEEIKKKIFDLNTLFEQAAFYNIKFDCNFTQDQSFSGRYIAHLNIKVFKEI